VYQGLNEVWSPIIRGKGKGSEKTFEAKFSGKIPSNQVVREGVNSPSSQSNQRLGHFHIVIVCSNFSNL